MVGLAAAFRVSEAAGAEMFWTVGVDAFRAVDVEIGWTADAFAAMKTEKAKNINGKAKT